MRRRIVCNQTTINQIRVSISWLFSTRFAPPYCIRLNKENTEALIEFAGIFAIDVTLETLSII